MLKTTPESDRLRWLLERVVQAHTVARRVTCMFDRNTDEMRTIAEEVVRSEDEMWAALVEYRCVQYAARSEPRVSYDYESPVVVMMEMLVEFLGIVNGPHVQLRTERPREEVFEAVADARDAPSGHGVQRVWQLHSDRMAQWKAAGLGASVWTSLRTVASNTAKSPENSVAPAGMWSPENLLEALVGGTEADKEKAMRAAGILDEDGKPTARYLNLANRVRCEVANALTGTLSDFEALRAIEATKPDAG